MAIGKNLKNIAKKKKISIKQLSEKSGISVNTLYGIIKRDNETVKPDIITEIANVLDVQVSDLLGLNEQEASNKAYTYKEFGDFYNDEQEKNEGEALLNYIDNAKYLENLELEEIKDLKLLIDEYPEGALRALSIRCRQLRIEKDLSEKTLANNAGISLETFLEFENNNKNIGIRKIKSIFSALGIDDTFLIGFITGYLSTTIKITERNNLIDKLPLAENLKEFLILLTKSSKTAQEEAIKYLEESMQDNKNNDSNNE